MTMTKAIERLRALSHLTWELDGPRVLLSAMPETDDDPELTLGPVAALALTADRERIDRVLADEIRSEFQERVEACKEDIKRQMADDRRGNGEDQPPKTQAEDEVLRYTLAAITDDEPRAMAVSDLLGIDRMTLGRIERAAEDVSRLHGAAIIKALASEHNELHQQYRKFLNDEGRQMTDQQNEPVEIGVAFNRYTSPKGEDPATVWVRRGRSQPKAAAAIVTRADEGDGWVTLGWSPNGPGVIAEKLEYYQAIGQAVLHAREIAIGAVETEAETQGALQPAEAEGGSRITATADKAPVTADPGTWENKGYAVE